MNILASLTVEVWRFELKLVQSGLENRVTEGGLAAVWGVRFVAASRVFVYSCFIFVSKA